MESKEQNKQTKQKQTHRYRDHSDSHQIRDERGKGIKKYKLVVTK